MAKKCGLYSKDAVSGLVVTCDRPPNHPPPCECVVRVRWVPKPMNEPDVVVERVQLLDTE